MEAVHAVVREVERRVVVAERIHLRPVQILFYRRAMQIIVLDRIQFILLISPVRDALIPLVIRQFYIVFFAVGLDQRFFDGFLYHWVLVVVLLSNVDSRSNATAVFVCLKVLVLRTHPHNLEPLQFLVLRMHFHVFSFQKLSAR